jgi:hypothetical protein
LYGQEGFEALTMASQNGKEKAERANQIINSALHSLAEALGRGESKGLKEHLKAFARFSRYSASNALLIVSQCPDATRVEGFKAWQRLGRQVKKGEKGILIRAPFTIHKDEEQGQPGEERTFFGFRAAYVFDVSQTDGEPLPEIGEALGDPGHYTKALKEYASAHGITVTSDKELCCHGISHGGAVEIREGLPPAEEFSTLVHELTHEILHFGETTKPPRRVRELEAEAVAFVVSEAIGLNSLQAATDYIHLYRGDAATLWDSLERIQKASSELIAALGAVRDEKLAA